MNNPNTTSKEKNDLDDKWGRFAEEMKNTTPSPKNAKDDDLARRRAELRKKSINYDEELAQRRAALPQNAITLSTRDSASKSEHPKGADQISPEIPEIPEFLRHASANALKTQDKPPHSPNREPNTPTTQAKKTQEDSNEKDREIPDEEASGEKNKKAPNKKIDKVKRALGKTALILLSGLALGKAADKISDNSQKATESTTKNPKEYVSAYDGKAEKPKIERPVEIVESINEKTNERQFAATVKDKNETTDKKQSLNNHDQKFKTNEIEKQEKSSTEDKEKAKTENESNIDDDMSLEVIYGEKDIENKLKFTKKVFKENKETYQKIVDQVKKDTGIDMPAELICAIHFREANCDFNACLQDGTPLEDNSQFDNFFDSAVSAIEEQLNAYSDYSKMDFSKMQAICEFANRYNGVGSRKYYGLPSGYVYSGTKEYRGGRYAEDGIFDENADDPRIGVYVIVISLADII